MNTNIPSFEKDHIHMQPGFSLSTRQGDIYTYDVRFCKPNTGGYLSYAAVHSIEHMLAAALRNGAAAEKIIYFGPMGCRTGFYLLLRNTETAEARRILLGAVETALDMAAVPGAEENSCGNFAEHSLAAAKREMKKYRGLL